jgi:hypothetical protein
MDRFIEPDTSVDASATRLPLEVEMDRFIHNSNIEHYRRLIAESECNPSRDEDRHAMLYRDGPWPRSHHSGVRQLSGAKRT